MPIKVLKEKSGASLIFVIFIMMMLSAVCISVLVAASSSVSAAANRIYYDRLIICADSVQKNIAYSLQNNDGDPSDQLWGQLFMAVFHGNDPDSSKIVDLSDTKDVDISFLSGSDPKNLGIKSITLDFPEQSLIVLQESQEAVDDIPGIPEIISVGARLLVTTRLEIDSKGMTTVAVYEFTGGKLVDKSVTEWGEWRLISYEKADR